MWTKEELNALIQTRLLGYKMIVVSNREPYTHQFAGDRIECVQPASGMAAALDPVLRTCGGTWVAHGGGDADRQTVDEHDRVEVPPADPKYTLRRVWLTEQQRNDYYLGCSNESIWPLCHVAFTRPIYEERYWESYREVNGVFAHAILEEAGGKPAFVFIQDYHFGLLPRILKNQNPGLIVAQFWHIPWPTPEIFRTFPWGEELLDGLLGNDVLGFHLRYHSRNFLDCVRTGIEAKADQNGFNVTRGGSVTQVRAFPISIDFEAQSALGASPEVASEMERWRGELNLDGKVLGIGIDRIDYTKGIPERLRAMDRLLELYPDLRGRLVFAQIAVPSRGQIRNYQLLDQEITDLARTINQRWSTEGWSPVRLLKRTYSAREMSALHRLAHFCVVSALHDGMNLVAKEFVGSRTDDDGVLILSKFTGAARELTDALLVNPFGVNEITTASRLAIIMPIEERQRRMRKMRWAVAQNNIYRWATELLSALLKVDFPEPI